MTQPSEYELAAWRDIQAFKSRLLSRKMRDAGEQVIHGTSTLHTRATKYLETHPNADAALERVQDVASKGGRAVLAGAHQGADLVPDGVADWGGSALAAMQRTLGKVSRAGLSPKRVVARHQKLGHDVAFLRDLRRLDLEQIDAVRGRAASWYYPAIAALSGAGAGLAISGGEFVIIPSAGASAAPSATVVAGAFVADSAAVLGLTSRAAGNVSLLYGYNPEDPGEKLFVMSVINAGTAMSASAKTAAMADISRLTQALFRGKAWAILDKSLVTQVSKRFASAFAIRFTKQSLGKVLPAVGIALGGAFNWATLESTVDAADVAYRRRFLLEKYPQLADEEIHGTVQNAAPDDTDVVISVLSEIAATGGPDLRKG